MKYLIGIFLMVAGILAVVSATFLWVGYAIFQMVQTDLGFFAIVLPCAGYWAIQMVLGYAGIVVGGVIRD